MQQKYLFQKKYYHLSLLDGNKNYSEQAKRRAEILSDYETLKDEGVSEDSIFAVLKTSRASYYRWEKRYKKDFFLLSSIIMRLS